MRTFFIILLSTLPAFGADDLDIGNPRLAKHTLLPIVGYQYLNGQQRGVDWDMTFRTYQQDGFADSTFYYNGKFRGEDDLEPPVLGLLYRYRFDEMIVLQASAVVIQDRARFVYPLTLDFFGFTRRDEIVVERGNTSWLNIGAAYDFKTPLTWITGLAQVDVGFATRNIQRHNAIAEGQGADIKVTILEDENMFTVRGGLDFTLWKNDNLILQGGLNYSQFFPIETEVDPFGGLGWRFSVFPVWSGE